MDASPHISPIRRQNLFNESGKYLWRSWSGLRAPLFAGFAADIEFEIDYDSEPAVQVDKTDTTLQAEARLRVGLI